MTKDALRARLKQCGVDTRDFFYQAAEQPVVQSAFAPRGASADEQSVCRNSVRKGDGLIPRSLHGKRESRACSGAHINDQFGNTQNHFPVTKDIAARGFYLPSGLALTEAQLSSVCDAIHDILRSS